MSVVTGVAEALSKKSAYGTYGMLVDGKWYNSKFPIKAEKGDTVEFDDGGKNYVQKLKVTNKGPGGGEKPAGVARSTGYSRGRFPIDKEDGQISIIRQNALTNAVKSLDYITEENAKLSPEDMVSMVIDIARTFESYTSGDIDRQAMERMEFDPE